jgi:DNA-binding MarR family transcriptional regulator
MMARKIDGPAVDSITLPYRSAALADLVRLMTVWTSTGFQASMAGAASLPDDANAIPALYHLAASGPLRPSAMAAAHHVSAPTASRLIEKLSAAGLVLRTPDPQDSRATLVALTPEGATVARELFEAGDVMMATLQANWSDAERETFAGLLSKLVAATATFTPA